MRLEKMPQQAAWDHHGVRSGFEVLFAESGDTWHVLRGSTTAWEGASAWSVGYLIELDEQWRTRRVSATARVANHDLVLSAERLDGDRWLVDGERQPDLDGCVDIDFESSVVTNTLPVHRLGLPMGEAVSVPAAFVRTDDLRLERIEQTYCRKPDGPGEHNFDYESSTFGFACSLAYDEAGLVLQYPGIGIRFNDEDGKGRPRGS